MIKNKREILVKGYVVSVVLVIIAVGIIVKLIDLQTDPKERARFEEFAQRTNFREAKFRHNAVTSMPLTVACWQHLFAIMTSPLTAKRCVKI